MIGPYALGGLSGLFVAPAGGVFPLSPELYGIATFASIVLLYLTGLETDLHLFLRYSLPGSVVGIGGVLAAFLGGALAAVGLGVADSFFSPAALFLGTISTATSVGITARILEEKRQLQSPEGVTVLAAAVIDDVLGIIILTMVLAYSQVHEAGGSVDWGQIGYTAAIALGFWIGATATGILLARRIGEALSWFRDGTTMATLSLGLALIVAGLSEMAGLALIVGAYITGLALSRAGCAHELKRRLEPVYKTLVCVFFCAMGMLVDIWAMQAMLVFGLLYTLIVTVTKAAGCALPALFLGFNRLGSLRIGAGMTPRGEVALIIAGIGYVQGIVNSEIFGVAILMTVLTTMAAPPAMVRLFDDRSGRREEGAESAALRHLTLPLPDADTAEFLVLIVLQTFRNENCFVQRIAPAEPLYRISYEDVDITVQQEGSQVVLTSGESDYEFARLVLLEGIARLIGTFESLRGEQLENSLRGRLF